MCQIEKTLFAVLDITERNKTTLESLSEREFFFRLKVQQHWCGQYESQHGTDLPFVR